MAEPGVISATTKAPSNKAKKGCNFKPIIPPTTMHTPINKIKIGSVKKTGKLINVGFYKLLSWSLMYWPFCVPHLLQKQHQLRRLSFLFLSDDRLNNHLD